MKQYTETRVTRREAFRKIAAAGVAVGVAGATRHAAAHHRETEVRPDAAVAHGLSPADEGVRAFFGTIEPGVVLEGRWTVEAVHAPRMGGVPVVLSDGGARFAVEVLRRDPEGPSPVARTARVDIFLSNRGDGSHRSDETNGLGAMALGRALAAREAGGATPPALMTHRERSSRHPVGIFTVPVSR